MHVISRIAVAVLSLAPAVLARPGYKASVKLIASHYSGQIYTLDFSGSKLTSQSKTDGCGRIPGWIDYYSDDKSLYCYDESWYGSGYIVSYNVSTDGTLKQFARAPTTGNDVHGTLYGGSNGKGFVATAQ
jgi:6-phosphogluconolactonase (cycloisomerase 2 family)